MRILIRADGNAVIGTGHVMRTLALAQRTLDEGGHASLAAIELDDAVAQRVEEAGVSVIRGAGVRGSAADAVWTADAARDMDAAWVVADGYCFGDSFQRLLHAGGNRVLLMDDWGHASRYSAEVVVNQNFGADGALYANRAAGTRLLLGPSYALLRPAFADATHGRDHRPADRARRILLTFGGADPNNVTRRLVDLFRSIPTPDLEIRVVIGPANPHAASLAGGLDHRMTLVGPTTDMIAHMTWADLAFTSPSGTMYELCCLGVPTALVTQTDEQRKVGDRARDGGIFEHLGSYDALGDQTIERVTDLLASSARRHAMIARGRETVDGRGATRILTALRDATR